MVVKYRISKTKPSAPILLRSASNKSVRFFHFETNWKLTMIQRLFAPVVLLSIFFAGCGGEDLRQIKGTVTHNGKPVADLYLTFMPEDPKTQPASSSTTDKNGKYELKIGSAGGVVPGKYTVTCSDPAAMMGGKSSDDPNYAIVCKKYAQGTSKYVIDVQKSNSNLELKLD